MDSPERDLGARPLMAIERDEGGTGAGTLGCGFRTIERAHARGELPAPMGHRGARRRYAEARADRFDLGEALLEIGLAITSITLLTRKRAYWYIGPGFSVAGIVAAAFGVLLKQDC